MSLFDRALVHLGTLLLGTLLVGLLVRGRYRACLSFLLYVIAVLSSSLLIGLWPQRFYRWDFYIFKETVHNLLKFAVALELALRTFQSFPGARATARRLVFVAVTVTWATLLSLPSENPEYEQILGEIHARALNGTVWLLTAIAVTILWYRLPVDRFAKAILLGFAPYLLVFAVGLNAVARLGLEKAKIFSVTHASVYCLLLAYWNYAAWRTSDQPSRRPVDEGAAPA